MRKIGAGLLAFTIALALAAVARAKGYNDAGCGLGSLIFDNNTKGQQILAATTNQYFAQDFSITTGTSGCEKEDYSAMRRHERERFAAANLRSLSRDLAAGQGPFGSSMARLMGCKEEAVPAFLSLAREHFDELFPKGKADAGSLVRDLEAQIASHKELSASCTL